MLENILLILAVLVFMFAYTWMVIIFCGWMTGWTQFKADMRKYDWSKQDGKDNKNL
jgi:membrane glycosyltransferase